MALNIAKSPLVGPILALNGWTFVMEASIRFPGPQSLILTFGCSCGCMQDAFRPSIKHQRPASWRFHQL